MSTAIPHSPVAVTWHVLGAGAIGGLQALRLAARGLRVVLLARDAEPLRQLVLEDGTTRSSEIFDQVQATTCGPIHRLLVATKSHLTAEALRPFLPSLAPDAVVVLLQNGMGSEDWLRERRPDLHVLAAITTDGVFRPAPDHLVLAGHGETWLGAPDAADATLAAATATTLGMGFAPDLRHRRWLKLAMNCAINPLTALRRCRNGDLLQDPAALARMRDVCAEVAAVMQAEGLDADGGDLFRLACETAGKTAANTSSMCADVIAGRATEIDFLNGFVVARGQAHGVATPVNTGLCAAIHDLS